MKLLLSILFFSAMAITSHSQPVKKLGHLHVDKTLLKDEKGNIVTLRGMSFGWHNWWPRFYNAGAVQWLATDFKCDIVRAAMGVEPRGGYLDKPSESQAMIEAVVDAAIKEGIYVIIDWHSHHIKKEEAIIFFTAMAKKYGKYPNIIYEIFNEPIRDSWKKVKEYSIDVIKAIRAEDPDNIILVGSPHWDQDVHIAADNPIQGYQNLMYTLHYYAATHKKDLRDSADYALQKGLPLFISESAGMEATGDGKIDVEEWNQWILWSEKNNLSWLTWSVADKDETCSILKKTAASDGKWTEDNLKESGIMIRKYLRDFAAKNDK